ncbi:hypothetical protein SARC_06145 [Sphaeroforma arctica JP610]|uniref:m7GpppX diphosphatase n=1 Tax=Sphaeroforma arctica JP610 TaxID=667725 RepID=A0A0L0FZZ5_9EUKA|nr:hypothetical protein SARC_06145 [Sphaeroforma arctica JP610]KNC81538.1 hypothetical protein SARC_06145 [Sphaeroforma arctica JP610]|eukprot:XP_014155440.1 hypothetical protein SARC_06145 [Sphaeroforma arctica JP610]
MTVSMSNVDDQTLSEVITVSSQDVAADFTFEAVLREMSDTKSCFLRGSMKGQPAILVLEKPPFKCDVISSQVASLSDVSIEMHNDIYSNLTGLSAPEFNRLSLKLICPATETHFRKYGPQDMAVVTETPELYQKVTLPYIKGIPSSRIQWVYNIIEGTKEADRVILRDDDPTDGFVLVMDMKWDGSQPESCYCVAIVQNRNVRSVRDLTRNLLPLLENILDKGSKCLAEKYGIPLSMQRVFIHYQPSYYHFHVHFTHVKYLAPGTHCGKAHLLQDVIANINLMDDYYSKASLTMIMGTNHHLYQLLAAHMWSVGESCF